MPKGSSMNVMNDLVKSPGLIAMGNLVLKWWEHLMHIWTIWMSIWYKLPFEYRPVTSEVFNHNIGSFLVIYNQIVMTLHEWYWDISPDDHQPHHSQFQPCASLRKFPQRRQPSQRVATNSNLTSDATISNPRPSTTHSFQSPAHIMSVSDLSPLFNI